MDQDRIEISKDEILRVLDQYCHIRKGREIMAVYLTDYPGSMEKLAEECDVSLSTVWRAVNRNAFLYKYLPGKEMKMK